MHIARFAFDGDRQCCWQAGNSNAGCRTGPPGGIEGKTTCRRAYRGRTTRHHAQIRPIRPHQRTADTAIRGRVGARNREIHLRRTGREADADGPAGGNRRLLRITQRRDNLIAQRSLLEAVLSRKTLQHRCSKNTDNHDQDYKLQEGEPAASRIGNS